MATSTGTTEKTTQKPTVHRYVVLSDALVVTTGKKANGRPEYTRILRGGVLNGSAESETIKDLLHKRSIMKVTSREHLAEVQADLEDPLRSKHRQTVRKASQAMGAEDDPVEAPQSDIQPVAAPLPETSPDAILPDTE